MTIEPIIIRNVTDLLQLDARQLDACLKDLKTWVEFRKNLDSMLEAMKAAFGESIVAQEVQDHMAWIDDGIEGGQVDLHILRADENGKPIEESRVSLENAMRIDGAGNITNNL